MLRTSRPGSCPSPVHGRECSICIRDVPIRPAYRSASKVSFIEAFDPLSGSNTEGPCLTMKLRVKSIHPLLGSVPRCPQLAHLSLRAPDTLEDAVPLRKPVHRVVALAHRPHKAAEGIDVVLALDGPAVLGDFRNGDLDGRMVLGLDDAICSAALARDVAGRSNDISSWGGIHGLRKRAQN